LAQVLAVGQRRQPFATQSRQLQRHRAWWVEVARRLDPPAEAGQPRPTRHGSEHQGKDFLAHLAQPAQGYPEAAAGVTPIWAPFRHRWPRLFACSAWPARSRPNTALETCWGRVRTPQRQLHGPTSGPEFSIRYAEGAVFLDPSQSFEQGLQRFQQVDQAEFAQGYARFLEAPQRLPVLSRFRHQPRRCLKQLEQQGAEAVRRKSRDNAR